MPAITATITVRLPERLLERVDEAAAAGAVSRNAWLVATLYWCLESGAVERALGDVEGSVRVEADAPRMSDGRDVDSPPAPAEQPEVFRQRDLVQTRDGPSREFRPYPKGGKR